VKKEEFEWLKKYLGHTFKQIENKEYELGRKPTTGEYWEILEEMSELDPPPIDEKQSEICPECGSYIAWDFKKELFYCFHCHSEGVSIKEAPK
jgi:hypothetical protein